MGQIKISVYGSFDPNEEKMFSALEGGHADAVAQAIEWLASTVLPNAIKHDHWLHSQGDNPQLGFGRSKTVRQYKHEANIL